MALFDFLTGRKPRKEAYALSPGARAQGREARASAAHWNNTLRPLLTQYRDMTFDHDPSGTLTGRAGADIAQASQGIGTPTFRGAGVSSSSLSDMGQRTSAAIQNQLGAEQEAVYGQQLQDQLNVLEGAAGQDMAAARAMSDLSRSQQQENINKLRGEQQVRQAKGRFFTDTAAMLLGQGGRNIGSGGTFLEGQGNMVFNPTTGHWGRYQNTGFFGLGKKDWKDYSSMTGLPSSSSGGGD